jgi:response regulator RpfG family c-di-GMP phosphodiesterase
MDAKVLVVDDDPNILAAFRRQWHHRAAVETAASAEDALDLLAARGPFAVLISDFRMPGMDGIAFLSRARQLAPDTVRIMLTGHADLDTAIEAVNAGNIFRFLTKPCGPELMAAALQAGLDQYRLVTAERDLLEKTLSGSVKVLSDVLALVNPTAFGRANRIHRRVRVLLKQWRHPSWEIEMAALLSQIGCVTVPEPVLQKAARGDLLTEAESRMIEQHPQVGHDLLVRIPRLEGVAAAIAYQNKNFDGSGSPADPKAGDAIPLGARILKAVLDLDQLENQGLASRDAIGAMKQTSRLYDPHVLNSLENAVILMQAGDRYQLKEVGVRELGPHMIFATDVLSTQGLLLVSKGQEASPPLLLLLRNFLINGAVAEPLKVLIPCAERSGTAGPAARAP